MSKFDLDGALRSSRDLNHILVCPHDDPDPDALAAAWALSRLLDHELSLNTTIAFAGLIGRAENRAMVDQLGIELTRIRTLDLGRFDGVFLVDTQPPARNHSAPPALPIVGCVDHHPRREMERPIPWYDVREDFGTTSSISLNYLIRKSIEVDRDLATAILYAVKTDTRDFSREATENDLKAHDYVFSRADHRKLGAIVNPKLDHVYFRMLHRALDRAFVHGPSIVVFLSDLPYPDLVAEIADLFVRRKGNDWCLCGGTYDHALRFSLRTEIGTAQADELAQNLVAPYGGSAGGHGMSAGGRLPLEDRPPAAIWEKVVRDFCRALTTDDPGRALLPVCEKRNPSR